jgi:hypothetical protein
VWVELSGDGGKMGWTQLPDGVGNPFQRGEVDVFEIEGSDVGTPEKLGVKHDDKGYGPAWHLALVEVRHNGGAGARAGGGGWDAQNRSYVKGNGIKSSETPMPRGGGGDPCRTRAS